MSSSAEISSPTTIESDGRHEYDSQTPDPKQAVTETAYTYARPTPLEPEIESQAGGHATSVKRESLPSFAELLSHVFPNKPQGEPDGLPPTNTQSCEQCSIQNRRYYLLNIESPTSPHTSELIISIDPEDLSRTQWLATHFIENIHRIYPPPPSPKDSHLSIGIRDPAYPEGHFREISPSTYLSLLLREQYNPMVRCGNIYCHVPEFSLVSGGNSIKVLYKEKPQVPHRTLDHSEYSTSPISQTPSRILPGTGRGQHMKDSYRETPSNGPWVEMEQCTPATAPPPQPMKPNYVAIITIQFMSSDPTEQIRIFRPPLELEVEQEGNFYTLQATVEETLRNANAVMGMGPLSELVGRNAILVYLAYNKFIIPAHFAWNKNTFAEFDPEHRGGTLKMHLTAWVLEHPLADPSGVPTGLPPNHLQSQSRWGDWTLYQETSGGEETHRCGYTRNREKGKERESDVSYGGGGQHHYTLPQVAMNEYSGERNKGYHSRGTFGDVPTAEHENEISAALHFRGNNLEDERVQGYFLEPWKGRVSSHSSSPLGTIDEGAIGGSKQIDNNSRPMGQSPDPHNRPDNQEAIQESPHSAIGRRPPKKARNSAPAGPVPKRRRRG